MSSYSISQVSAILIISVQVWNQLRGLGCFILLFFSIYSTLMLFLCLGARAGINFHIKPLEFLYLTLGKSLGMKIFVSQKCFFYYYYQQTHWRLEHTRILKDPSGFQIINTFSTEKITAYLITTPFNSRQTTGFLNDKGTILMKRKGAYLSQNSKAR